MDAEKAARSEPAAEALRQFYEEIKDCQKCPLGQCRTNLVFGTGSAEAEIVFVGEAPGYHEDQKGEPFVGAAGKLLTRLLERIGRSREGVYIANVLKCRPPENRSPHPDEIESCKPHLFRQLDIIAPTVLCTLGNFATQTIIGKRVGISTIHGRRFDVDNRIVFPIYHPAAALHRGDLLGPLEQDFDKLKDFLASGAVPVREPEQLSFL